MPLMDSLPVVDKCCFFVDLKLGCIIIAIWGIIHGSLDVSLFLVPQVCKNSNGLFSTLLRIAIYLCSVSTMLFLLSCIIFLVGIFIHRKVTAMVYLYCNALSILTYIFFFITCIFVKFFEKDCEVTLYLISILINIIIWTHFLLVVRSYKDVMD